MQRPCVVPVDAQSAIAWSKGQLHDRDLLLKSPLRPEAIFIVDLPGIDAMAELTRLIRYWFERGAICYIARTGTPIVAARLIREGAIKCFHEDTDPPKDRYLVPPEAFKKRMQRWLR